MALLSASASFSADYSDFTVQTCIDPWNLIPKKKYFWHIAGRILKFALPASPDKPEVPSIIVIDRMCVQLQGSQTTSGVTFDYPYNSR